MLAALTLLGCSDNQERMMLFYTIIFNSDGGTIVSKQLVEAGKTVTVLDNPSKQGYVFLYWSLNDTSTAYNFQTPVNSDITLTAKWEEETQAETLTVRTITEALNYSGDKNTVTKLIITDFIAGNDYSVGSEWNKFRTLDETFPNIEALEILTDQNIPDFDETNLHSLFCWTEYVPDSWLGHYVNHSSKWLKTFSAPNIKNISSRVFAYCENLINVNFPLAETIGEFAFYNCSDLISVDFPLTQTIGHSAFWSCSKLTSINFPIAKTIESMAFCYCENLDTVSFPLVQTIGYDAFSTCYSLVSLNFPLVQTIGSSAFSNCTGLISVDFPLLQIIGHSAFSTCLNLTSAKFPLVQTIENYAFYRCNSLVSVSFGTAFWEKTEIIFKARVFLGDNFASTIRTENIDLTLGKYVLPEPNLSAKIWQNTNGSNDGTSHLDFDYIWKSITVK